MNIEELTATYLDGLKDSEITALAKALEGADASYTKLYQFTDKSTAALIKAYEKIAGEKLTVEQAEQLVRPLLDRHVEMIANYAQSTQAAVNAKVGIKLKAQRVSPSRDRSDGIIKKLCSGDLEDTRWVLDSGVTAYAKSVVDETCKLNAEQQYRAGLTPVITRRTGPGGCCEWCKQWVGTWTYPDVPDEIYMRHRACDCVVEYKNGKMSQNIHTKEWSNLQPSEVVKNPGASLTQKQAEDYEQYLKQKKRREAIDNLARDSGLSFEDAAKEYHLYTERLRDRARYRAGQRRNSHYK